MLIAALQIVFWISLFLLVYSYALYPLLLSLFARLFGRPAAADESYFPRVGVVVPVYNEEAVVRRKIENLLALDYPKDKLSVWIGSDCSTDATHEIVGSIGDPRVHLWVADARGGKTEVINKLAPQIPAEVLMFTDANTMHRRGSLRKMVRHFADPSVGGVGGHIEHLFARKEFVEVLYRSFESRQKVLESRLHSTISAYGGFYSVRKELFRPIQYNAYSNDDVLIPMNIIRNNCRIIFDADAVSEEETTENIKHEFSRRIRIGAGNFQAFFWLLDFLSPLKGWPWFCYVSHKATRWFSPFFIIFAALSCAVLAFAGGPGFYAVLFYTAVFLTAVALSYRIIPLPPVRALNYFITMNAALFAGFFRYVSGIRSAAWSRTERPVDKKK
jgi:cellulose synthase/poly-beta-1,6-N-acetylglucosamine synthase-like glycosyltransferase